MARTEARLDATGEVARRRSAGPPRNRGWEPVAPRTDRARVDVTDEAEIERQAALYQPPETLTDTPTLPSPASGGGLARDCRRSIGADFGRLVLDDAEAAEDAAARGRRVRRRAGLSQAEFACRIGISVAI